MTATTIRAHFTSCPRKQVHGETPALDRDVILKWIEKLSREIFKRRKANNEKNKAIKWNPDNTLKTEQKRLLDWIEAELNQIIRPE